jgi:hypothetical protein
MKMIMSIVLRDKELYSGEEQFKMKQALTILFIICSNLCLSQIRDTTISDTSHLSIDQSFEASISMFSPGVAIYTSEIKSYMSRNNYYNVAFIGLCFKNISANFLFNLKGINLIDSFTSDNRIWPEGSELTYYSTGYNLSYTLHLTSRLSAKPFAGVSSSNYYLVRSNLNDPEQKSNKSFCGQFGINAEYRFKPKRINLFAEGAGDIKWIDRYWSVLLQTGIFSSIFKGNTGLKGNMLYFAIGGSYNFGEYGHHKK